MRLSSTHQPSLITYITYIIIILVLASRYGVFNGRLQASWADFQSNVGKKKTLIACETSLSSLADLSGDPLTPASFSPSIFFPSHEKRLGKLAPHRCGRQAGPPAWRGKASRRRSRGRASRGPGATRLGETAAVADGCPRRRSVARVGEPAAAVLAWNGIDWDWKKWKESWPTGGVHSESEM